MIRVFVVDDHEIVRRGVVDLVESARDMEVVGEAGTVRQAAARIPAAAPDVAVLDVRLPDGSGVDLCRDLRSTMPGLACLMLTAHDDDDATFDAVLAGAAGYLLKSVGAKTLLDDIRAVAGGKILLSAVASQRASAQMRDQPHDDPRMGSLGLRERQVLALIADGLTNRQIGERLGLAEKTVKNYVSSLLSKLGVGSRTQAALLRVEYDDTR
ncbi:LuxR family two component transcriptional regulator [Microbacterium sp. AG1240]|uniref:response regulator n=1 Tax=Microbacterium sp. AG1240 TaxID=2183992 RepID=UPI000EAD0C48|nr:response regulator transcription factor [Microbacterium sp. AG1240]RKT31107.1 LuxR family two component transcriptional regulator [Microbacterium sp. AG1240]